MTDGTVCPCCGSPVDRHTLPLDADLADLRARVWVSPIGGRVFLILFDAITEGAAIGRVLSCDSLLTALEIRARQVSSEDGINRALKRLREALRGMGWPVRVHNLSGVGWYLERKPGWHWRDEPTTLQRQIAGDEFAFQKGGFQ